MLLLLPLSHCTLLARNMWHRMNLSMNSSYPKYSQIPFDRSTYLLLQVEPISKKIQWNFFRSAVFISTQCRKTRPNFCGLNPLVGQRFSLNHTTTEIPIIYPIGAFPVDYFLAQFYYGNVQYWFNIQHETARKIFFFRIFRHAKNNKFWKENKRIQKVMQTVFVIFFGSNVQSLEFCIRCAWMSGLWLYDVTP